MDWLMRAKEDRPADWVEEFIQTREVEKPEPREEQNLYCFLCGEKITSLKERISMNGAHEHVFSNPAGFVFEIGCFHEAPGCSQTGDFTEDFTWFPGYAWRYAFCTSCRAHLGWVYRGADEGLEQFFGLILNRLIRSKQYFPSKS